MVHLFRRKYAANARPATDANSEWRGETGQFGSIATEFWCRVVAAKAYRRWRRRRNQQWCPGTRRHWKSRMQHRWGGEDGSWWVEVLEEELEQ